MADTFKTVVEYKPTEHLRVTEDEFDRFAQAAYETEERLPEVLECHVSADLKEQVIEVEFIVLADDEEAAKLNAEWICSGIAHRADILAGRATTVGSDTRTERLTPA